MEQVYVNHNGNTVTVGKRDKLIPFYNAICGTKYTTDSIMVGIITDENCETFKLIEGKELVDVLKYWQYSHKINMKGV